MNRERLIECLPAYRDEWIVVTKRQTVRSIIREVLNAHDEFAPHYDLIALYFDADSVPEICSKLVAFCKENIRYKEESDDDQTTAVPAGILTRGYGDCKHYAGFCGGVLDAINRATGKNIRWKYRFASYRIFDSVPHHVFIVVDAAGREIWIDPTPGVEGRTPIWYEDHKIKSGMALRRNIAGIGTDEVADVPAIATITDEDFNAALADVDLSDDLTDEQYQTIATLLNFGIIDEYGNVSVTRMDELQTELPADAYAEVLAAYNNFLAAAQVGGLFDGLWRGVKTVTLSIPRNAYLGLVALNVFGYASKLAKAFEDTDGKKKILDKWYGLGGKASALESAVNSGKKKKAILAGPAIGAAPAAAAPAWLTVAAGIIAAIMPLVAGILKKNNQYDQFAQYDTGYPGAYGSTGNSFMDFVRNNPVIVIGGAGLLLYWFMSDDKK